MTLTEIHRMATDIKNSLENVSLSEMKRDAERVQEANAARIVACVNALDGIPEPEQFIRLAKELIDKECLRDGCPQIWDTQEED